MKIGYQLGPMFVIMNQLLDFVQLNRLVSPPTTPVSATSTFQTWGHLGLMRRVPKTRIWRRIRSSPS